MTALQHGRVGTYTNHKCRCAECRAAWREYCYRLRRRRRNRLAPDDPRHGRTTTYQNWLCRCDACSQANADTERARRQRAAAA